MSSVLPKSFLAFEFSVQGESVSADENEYEVLSSLTPAHLHTAMKGT